MSEALADPKLQDEGGRIAALHRYEVLDSEPEEQFDKVTALIRTVLSVPISTVSLIDADRQWLKSCAVRDGVSLGIEMPRNASFCTHTIKSREPLIISDTLLDPRFVENEAVTGAPYIRSYLGVPLQTPDGYNVGSLCAIDIVPRDFSGEQVDMLKAFAAIVVDELELRNIARIDSLTGAVSRRGFLEETGKALSTFARHGLESSLIMFDIDHFKSINDKYGHAVGDVVLRSVSSVCEVLARNTDVFGRLGGEEFAILLRDTSTAGAMVAAERYRAEFARLNFDDYPDLYFTASFGVAGIAVDQTPESWLAAADKALYVAKRGGRNQCCLADYSD